MKSEKNRVYISSVMQSQNAVTAYLKSKHLLHFRFICTTEPIRSYPAVTPGAR